MARSQRLRFKDLRDVYLLVGECLELRVSPDAWNRHLIEGASRMVGAVGGVCIELQAPSPAHPPSRISFIDWGFDSPAHRTHWLRYMDDGEFARNPLMPGMLQRARPVAVYRRRSVIDDATWYRSSTFRAYMREGGVDDGVGALAVYRDGRAHALGVHRELLDRPLELRHERKIRLLYAEIAKRIGAELASWLLGPGQGLTPRERQVLELLLGGDSEKLIARRLGLSPHTVHDYVKAVYRAFGVHSRSELCARGCRDGEPDTLAEGPGGLSEC